MLIGCVCVCVCVCPDAVFSDGRWQQQQQPQNKKINIMIATALFVNDYWHCLSAAQALTSKVSRSSKKKFYKFENNCHHISSLSCVCVCLEISDRRQSVCSRQSAKTNNNAFLFKFGAVCAGRRTQVIIRFLERIHFKGAGKLP